LTVIDDVAERIDGQIACSEAIQRVQGGDEAGRTAAEYQLGTGNPEIVDTKNVGMLGCLAGWDASPPHTCSAHCAVTIGCPAAQVSVTAGTAKGVEQMFH